MNVTRSSSKKSLPSLVGRTRVHVHRSGGRCCIGNKNGHRLHVLGGRLRGVLIHGRSVGTLPRRLGMHCPISFVIGLGASARHSVVIPSFFRHVLSSRSNSFHRTLHRCYYIVVTSRCRRNLLQLLSCSIIHDQLGSRNIIRYNCIGGSNRQFVLAVLASGESVSSAV